MSGPAMTSEVVGGAGARDDTRPMAGVITTYVEAWEAGDLDAVLASYAPDIVAHYGGTSAFAGSHRGFARFVEVLAETAARSDRRLCSVEALHDDGDRGSVFVTESVRIDGEIHELQRALRVRVVDDRIAEVWLYDLDQHRVDQAWSQPPGG